MFFEHSVKLDSAFLVQLVLVQLVLLVLKSSVTAILEQGKHLKGLLLDRHPCWGSKWISGQNDFTYCTLISPFLFISLVKTTAQKPHLKKKNSVSRVWLICENFNIFTEKKSILSPVSYLSITCLVSTLHL